MGEGFQGHSNHSLQRFELEKKKKKKKKKKKQKKKKVPEVETQKKIQTPEHTYKRFPFMVSLVDNELSSKYCCIGLITMTNSIFTYHRH